MLVNLILSVGDAAFSWTPRIREIRFPLFASCFLHQSSSFSSSSTFSSSSSSSSYSTLYSIFCFFTFVFFSSIHRLQLIVSLYTVALRTFSLSFEFKRYVKSRGSMHRSWLLTVCRCNSGQISRDRHWFFILSLFFHLFLFFFFLVSIFLLYHTRGY